MAEIVMPRLSDTMEEGTILRWLKADGEQVARGEELVEIETDKATMTYESDQAGVLEILAGEGTTLPVGEPIARVGADVGADASPSASETGRATAATPAPTPTRADASAGDESGNTHAPASTPAADDDAGRRVKASPLAKRIAGERGIDLHGVSGSGPGGRIVKADVLADASGDAATSTARTAGAAALQTAPRRRYQRQRRPTRQHPRRRSRA